MSMDTATAMASTSGVGGGSPLRCAAPGLRHREVIGYFAPASLAWRTGRLAVATMAAAAEDAGPDPLEMRECSVVEIFACFIGRRGLKLRLHAGPDTLCKSGHRSV